MRKVGNPSSCCLESEFCAFEGARGPAGPASSAARGQHPAPRVLSPAHTPQPSPSDFLTNKVVLRKRVLGRLPLATRSGVQSKLGRSEAFLFTFAEIWRLREGGSGEPTAGWSGQRTRGAWPCQLPRDNPRCATERATGPRRRGDRASAGGRAEVREVLLSSAAPDGRRPGEETGPCCAAVGAGGQVAGGRRGTGVGAGAGVGVEKASEPPGRLPGEARRVRASRA